ncbi:MAG TPA: tetratricopeptide repeat protein [Verrucomicrobiae bacterium]|jgi:tetratricopeptide (TPR) repeat protein|nr:tetratricopeptide repeat protein [Verrucomicrobiae bacterium]
MTNETGLNRGARFVGCVQPWLLGGAMFVVYLFTLYHLATPETLNRLAGLAGWDWRPNFFAPVTFLVTYPIHWLPDHFKLPALNCFAACCAALALVLLARSVTLLPHDRTNEQRLREHSEFSLLSIPTAWLPPLFAVLVCGLQLSFWERAVEFRDESFLDNGEIFNLLIFAYVIRCLLEFRISRKESWLTRFALAYGLGLANNWAMIGYFPGFLAALIWIKGFDFFHWRFVVRMLGCGLAGTCLLLLFPLANHLRGYSDFTFGPTLRLILSNTKLALLRLPPEKKWLLLFALTSVLPVLLMGIRWASSFGDNSPMGVALATFGFNVGHAFLLFCCLWVSLDPPFSPRELVGFVPYLPLYYLGALSIGYFSGYLLLVFGVHRVKTRQRPPLLGRWPGRFVTAIVWLLAIATPLLLVARNLPQIKAGRAISQASDRYFSQVEHSLSSQGAVILADNDNLPMLYCLQATLARSGQKPDDIFIETGSLGQSWDYIHMLDEKYPEVRISAAFGATNIAQPSELDCIHLLEKLAEKREIYYLHSSFGYYFERFYPENHGLVYRLNLFPTNAWAPPSVPAELLAENRAFWKDASDDLQFVLRAMHNPAAPAAGGLLQRLEHIAHLSAETNQDVFIVGKYYSRALNSWGVKLAKSAPAEDTNTWREAGACFDLAQQLNPDNRPARINLEFNQNTLLGKPPVFKKLEEFDEILGNYRVWYQVTSDGGPLDEPNFCRGLGVALRDGNNYRQAVQQFERLHTLMPLDPSGPFQLSETYLYVLNHRGELYYAYPAPVQTAIAATAAAEEAVRIEPDSTNTLSLKALAYWQLGLLLQANTNLADPSLPSSSQVFSNSLAAIEQWLRLSPDQPNALFFKSMSLMQLGQLDQAIAPLSTLIDQSTNLVARLNRAICYLRLGKLDESKQDYELVIKAHPEVYQAYYGLGEIGYRKKDFPAAIKYYQLYESNGPPALKESEEYKAVDARLKELKSAP